MADERAESILSAHKEAFSHHATEKPDHHGIEGPKSTSQNIGEISAPFSKFKDDTIETPCVCPGHVLHEKSYIVTVIGQLEDVVKNSDTHPVCLAMPVITHIAQIQDLSHQDMFVPSALQFDRVTMHLASGIQLPGGSLSSHPPDAMFLRQYLSEETPMIKCLRKMFPRTPIHLFDRLIATRVAINFVNGVSPGNMITRSSFREEMDAVIRSFKSAAAPDGEIPRTPSKARAVLGLGSFALKRMASRISLGKTAERKEKQEEARERVNDLKGALHQLFTYAIVAILDDDVDSGVAVVEGVIRCLFENPDNYG